MDCKGLSENRLGEGDSINSVGSILLRAVSFYARRKIGTVPDGSRRGYKRRAERGPLGWALILLVGTWAGSSAASAETTVQDPGTFVVDDAHLLDAQTAAQLEGWLQKLAAETTAQVKLLTVGSLDGEDIFQFSQRHFTLWKLGQKGKNNGVLIVIAPGDRKLRIHPGYGLEGALPDSWCGTLSRHIARDYFRRGAFAEGARELVVAVVQKVAGEYGKTIAGAVPARFAPAQRQELQVNLALIVIVVLVMLALYWWAMRRGWIDASGRSGGWGGSYGGWGGSSGGWGGGDWGGGGGSFGGGGDSGGGGGGASW